MSTVLGSMAAPEHDRSARHAPARRVAVFGLDNFSRKNRMQLLGLNARGFAFDIFTNDALGDSSENLPSGNTLTRLEPGVAARIRQLVRYLRSHAGSLNHVEIYPGGRFAAVYAGLARVWKLPTLIVERGDLLYESRYGAITRLSMHACYRLATRVWYREPYQQARLTALGARSLFFLSNAVPMPAEDTGAARDVDFAWVNRLIVERRADWVVDVLATPEFAGSTAVMLGLLQGRTADDGMRNQQAYVTSRRPPNLTLHDFQDPTPLYRSARFFLLPSQIVYCNNALLEAMAHGVVPLVSDVEGARLIVDDGVDGLIFPHSSTGLRQAMLRALAMSREEWSAMSARAVAKVQAGFSVEPWAARLAAEYQHLRPARSHP